MNFNINIGPRRRRSTNPAIPTGTGSLVRRAIPLLSGRSRNVVASALVILIGLGVMAYKQHWLGIGQTEKQYSKDVTTTQPVSNTETHTTEAPPKADPTESDNPYAAFGLEKIGENRWRSPGGLIYGPDPTFGNRVEHILTHTRPDPSKPSHSVFALPAPMIFNVIDQAWVRHGKPNADDPASFCIYLGGKVIGKSNHGAECRHLQIVVALDSGGKNPKVPVEVISAYPVPKSGR